VDGAQFPAIRAFALTVVSSVTRMPHSYSLIRQALNGKDPRKVMVMKTVGRLLSNVSCTRTAKKYIAILTNSEPKKTKGF
jgi:hypothetical protein